jgi:nucleotide sugar dehydrogenase
MTSVDKVIYDLKSGKRKIAAWGLGYIGYSTLCFYAKNGIRAVGFDVDKKKVQALKRGQINLPNIEYWLGFDAKPLLKSSMMQATENWRNLISKDIAVHFICVPTEKDAMPYDKAIKDVINKIATYSQIKTDFPPLIIVESTLSVDRVRKVCIEELRKTKLNLWQDILFAVAPRRDWFVSAEKSVVTIPRIVGGITKEATELAAAVLGVVSHTVVKASDCFHAALIKSVENTYRQVGIALANQLSLAYPDINMTEVLNLVGTKWNVDRYHPSFGIGGYCIPLAPHYVLEGADRPEELTILKESISSSQEMPFQVANALIRKKIKKVGILGLAYKGDLKVDILSPTKDIVSFLKKNNVYVKVHDHYYSAQEIKTKCGADSFDFPEGMNQFEAILLATDHGLYRYTPVSDIVDNLRRCKYILDNTGLWSKIKWPENIQYHEAGWRHWLDL